MHALFTLKILTVFVSGYLEKKNIVCWSSTKQGIKHADLSHTPPALSCGSHGRPVEVFLLKYGASFPISKELSISPSSVPQNSHKCHFPLFVLPHRVAQMGIPLLFYGNTESADDAISHTLWASWASAGLPAPAHSGSRPPACSQRRNWKLGPAGRATCAPWPFRLQSVSSLHGLDLCLL